MVPTVDIPCLLTVYSATGGVTLMQYYLGLYSLPAVNWYIHSDRAMQNGIPDHDNPISLPLLNTLTQGVEVLGFECYLPVPQDADIPIYNTQGCVLNLTGCNPNWTYSVRVETWAFELPPNDTQPVKIYDYVYPLAFRPIYGSYIVETNMNMMIHTTAPKFAKQGQVITYKVFVTAVDAIGPTPGTPTMALEVGGTIDSRFTRNQTGITSANSIYATDVNGLPATQGRINYNVQSQLDGLTKRVYQTLAEMQLAKLRFCNGQRVVWSVESGVLS